MALLSKKVEDLETVPTNDDYAGQVHSFISMIFSNNNIKNVSLY